jgi:hypothetical protein
MNVHSASFHKVLHDLQMAIPDGAVQGCVTMIANIMHVCSGHLNQVFDDFQLAIFAGNGQCSTSSMVLHIDNCFTMVLVQCLDHIQAAFLPFWVALQKRTAARLSACDGSRVDDIGVASIAEGIRREWHFTATTTQVWDMGHGNGAVVARYALTLNAFAMTMIARSSLGRPCCLRLSRSTR